MCRIRFRNKIKTFEKRDRLSNFSERPSEKNTRKVNSDSLLKHAYHSVVQTVKPLERKCFICKNISTIDKEVHIKGGLASMTH